jgi:hypothetical protein
MKIECGDRFVIITVDYEAYLGVGSVNDSKSCIQYRNDVYVFVCRQVRR